MGGKKAFVLFATIAISVSSAVANGKVSKRPGCFGCRFGARVIGRFGDGFRCHGELVGAGGSRVGKGFVCKIND